MIPSAEDVFGPACESPTDPSPPTDERPDSNLFPDGWRLLDDVQLLDVPDPEYLVDGMIPRRGVGVIYSPSGAGKTTFISGLTTAVSSQPHFYNHPVLHHGPSAYVAAEDVTGFKVRTRAAKRAAGLSLTEPCGIYTFPEPIDLRDVGSVTMFAAFLKRELFPPQLEMLVIDTYAAATPGSSENSSEDMTTSMVHAQMLRDVLDATVILCHHTNAGGSRERGHSAMRGAADFMISLTPVDDAIHVECSKQRNAAPFEKFLLKMVPASDGQGCVLRLATDVLPSSTLTPTQAKALSVLRDTFGCEGATKSEWQRTCHDIPERSFHRACNVLQSSGHVRPVGPRFRASEVSA